MVFISISSLSAAMMVIPIACVISLKKLASYMLKKLQHVNRFI